MRNYSASFVLAFVTACGGGNDAPPDAIIIIDAPVDTAPPVDQPPDMQVLDLSCAGNAAPANGSAVDPIPVTGTASDFNLVAQSLDPVQDVQVRGFKNGAGQLDMDSTDAAGAFTLSLASGTNPIDGFVEASKAAHRTVRLYPPSPLTASLDGVPLLVITDTTFSFVVSLAGASQSPTNGTVGMIVADCANNPVGGAVPTAKQNGTDVGMMFDAGALQPGLFLFFDVPAGVTTVGATANGTTFRSHDIDVLAAVTSTTAVKPGF